MLPGHPPAKKARPVGAGGDEDPRGLLRIADVKAKAKVVAGHVPPHDPSKGKAKGKAVAALAAPAVGPGPPPDPKGKGKGKGRGKSKAKALALPLPPPAAVPLPAPPSPDFVIVAPAASSSSSSKAAAPPAPAAGARRRKGEKKAFMPAMGGGEVFYEAFREFGFGKLYKNWKFRCPHHPSCERIVGVISRNTLAHGELEPLAYLHVWRDVPPGPRGHRLTDAAPADVAAFYDAHELELKNLAELFGIDKPP